jgi:hypothetical protein
MGFVAVDKADGHMKIVRSWATSVSITHACIMTLAVNLGFYPFCRLWNIFYETLARSNCAMNQTILSIQPAIPSPIHHLQPFPVSTLFLITRFQHTKKKYYELTRRGPAGKVPRDIDLLGKENPSPMVQPRHRISRGGVLEETL